ncbi:MAG: BolA/IbaG family iron-sulfur metabolism protein [Gammaproteobacteria bacterium]|nr:BolA/IbaG family iron-sulfur metabolism protein [Gammaproteobacteria bacterium]MBU1655086.1 BolA/IbaG family iron-sulfur metabolism protein [Gammaproteobacteria bacterium]MBU1961558.1 BolA/IbaG family iron-sulfur metabolism protein [Gammaproteobacteria bacterium]
MNREATIRRLLTETFAPLHLEVIDESHMHSVPEGSESHFSVLLVSNHLRGMKTIDRHRSINRLLADEFSTGLHALALHTWIPDEWFERGGKAPESPLCLGGSKVG